jgi:hypothetical protein
MEAVRSSETSVHTRSTQRHIPEDGILNEMLHYHPRIRLQREREINKSNFLWIGLNPVLPLFLFDVLDWCILHATDLPLEKVRV